MRLTILALLAATLVSAQEYQKGTASTQQTQVTYGLPVASSAQTLYILNGSYKRDSAGSIVTLDTAAFRPYSGAPGACSNPITIQVSATAVQPTSKCELSYRASASDTSQDRFRFRLYTRYASPPGTDVNWREGQSLWDSVAVILTHTPPQLTTSGVSWGANFGLSGEQAMVCAERVDVGSGDTVRVIRPYLRCW